MSRYIDADKIEYRRNCSGCSGAWCDKCEDYIAERDQIDAIPTADVQEVKHGAWIEETERIRSVAIIPTYTTYYRCSECGRKEYKKEPYCNCGARMDGGDEK